MVGLVIVSHSAKLAEGVAELAREMGGRDVPIEVAGGLELPDRPMGTDATLIMGAIERAGAGGNEVLVLMDLGSAVLSAGMALEFLPEELRGRVSLSDAPLVEGAVAAAVTARIGATLSEVARQARGGLEAKVTHLVQAGPSPPQVATGPDTEADGEADAEGNEIRLVVRNPVGLHARPAARFVQTAGAYDADVRVANLTTGRGPVSAKSITSVMTLGVLQGHEVAIRASGPQAKEALAAITTLAEHNFGDEPEP